MARKKLIDLLTAVKKEESIAKRRLSETRKSRNETTATARTSWSAAGEREYAEGQLQVVEEYYSKLKKLRQEIEKASKTKPEKIKTPSFVKVSINGKDDSFYLVKNLANLTSEKLVSSSSPLGSAIFDKKENEEFSFEVAGNKLKGKVISYE